MLGLVLLLILQNKENESIVSTCTRLTNVFISAVKVDYPCYFTVYLSFLKLCNLNLFLRFIVYANLFKLIEKSLVGDKWRG